MMTWNEPAVAAFGRHRAPYDERIERERNHLREVLRDKLRHNGMRPRLWATAAAPKHAHPWVRSIERSLPKHRAPTRALPDTERIAA